MTETSTRGRKPLFQGPATKTVITLLKKFGLTGTQHFLAETGIRMSGKNKSTVNVSLPTLGKIADQAGITLTRGRPVTGKKSKKKPETVFETPQKRRGRPRKMVNPTGSENVMATFSPDSVSVSVISQDIGPMAWALYLLPLVTETDVLAEAVPETLVLVEVVPETLVEAISTVD